MKLCVLDSNWEYTIDTPYNKPLGGTQSSICYFLEEMSNLGHEVYLFNNIKEEQIIKNVIHVNVSNSLEYIKKNNIIFDVFIVSCLPQDLFQFKSILNSKNTLFCLWTGHDIDQPPSKILKDNKAKDMIDLFIFVSEWQKKRYLLKYDINESKTIIMKNGIGKPFEKYLDIETKKINNSLSYCSIPWRGLSLLPDIYNNVKCKINDLSLKIYSGMNIYQQKDNTDYKQLFKDNDNNIEYNEGISQSLLAEKLSEIEVLSYPNIFPETSCITVLQAMACGCIVITSDLGALKETMNNKNIYVNINPYEFNKLQYILEFSDKLKGILDIVPEFKEKIIEDNKKYIKENYLWKNICNKFCIDILNILLNYRNYVGNTHKELLDNFIENFNNSKWVESILYANQLKYPLTLNEYYIIKLNLGICYYKIDKLDEAKQCFKLCLELKNDYNINKNIALLELQKNNIKKFIKYAQQALTQEYDLELGNLLAEKYEMLGMYDCSISMYENILHLNDENINCNNNLGNLYLLRISQLENIDDVINKVYQNSLKLCVKNKENRKKELVLSNIIFNNLYNWKLSDEEIFKKSCVWYDYFPKEEKLIDISNKLDRRKRNKKLRIGYISCDFITHPVGFMFNSILKNHDTSNFEIFCYDCCDTGRKINDHLSFILRNYNNSTWRDLTNTDDEQALNIIVEDQLDILVDMMGHTRNTRMNLLQYKPAKVQISYFAYPSTNGLKEIDYRFTDKYASPSETQKYFVEKLYYLPNGFQCYTPPVDIESNKDYTRDKYKIHLCCFNNPTKLSIPTIDMFCEILKKLPESKLFLRYCYYKSSFYRECIIKLFTSRGISKERLDIGHEQIVNSLKMYDIIDITLDPFPYNGGTISSESIYMNTPIITLEGSNYISRVGTSLLSNLGLEKYIAKTKEEYIQKVIELANNEDELKILHKTLRIKMLKSDLADSISFTKNIEIAYKDIMNKYFLEI